MKKTLLYTPLLALLSMEVYGMNLKNNTDSKVSFYIYTDIGKKAQLIQLVSVDANTAKQFDVTKTLEALKESIVPNDFLEFKVSYSEYSAVCGERININTPADLHIADLDKQTLELKSASYDGCNRH